MLPGVLRMSLIPVSRMYSVYSSARAVCTVPRQMRAMGGMRSVCPRPDSIELMIVEPLLARIGLERAPAADVDGLHAVHRAFLSRVPYEGIAVQLGETAPLDEAALIERVLTGGRGGYCFELNTVL